ncbi:GAP family protein [Agrococcus sp. SGAir0287]|uniref:GAP family protein n=1 Tax=Agrococcus sp. SGAir0287 TaxID=2070347 RepID=UPI0010CCCF58|nr:GAP family protein [Agrococcus sp. SGAir0287]QCR18271.1 hypothetical protein C1N71_01425 [Agrococcus sp. SGAir0287]
MDLPTIGTLVVLALADSTSFGTLLIPIWLLLASTRPSVPRMLAYLGTVAGSYLVIGVLLSLAARLLLDDLQAWIASPVGGGVLMAAGVALFAASFWIARRAKAGREGGVPERILRWRDRALDAESGSVAPLMTLALTATALEVATLLPYLMAIGIMEGADLPLPVHGAALAGYVVVMVLPALVLLVVRLVAHRRIEPWLQRVNDWLMRQAGELTSWIVAIVGILLARAGADAFGGIGEVATAVSSVVQQAVQGLVPFG